MSTAAVCSMTSQYFLALAVVYLRRYVRFCDNVILYCSVFLDYNCTL
jgi:hypothetical protein